MKRLIVTVLFVLLFLMVGAQLATARVNENYISIEITDANQIHILTQLISIDQTDGLNVLAYATDEQLKVLKTLGYSYKSLKHPGENLNAHMAESIEEIRTYWDVYPTYEQYIELMNWYATAFPNICKLVTIGESQEGRLLLALRITDNPDIQEIEPEVLLTSTMHGDETTGYILMLHLIDDLLTSYGIDSELTNLVDNLDIYINPLANPDGTYAGGNSTVRNSKRLLSNGVDFNRNFPDPENDHPDGKPYAPETDAMMDFADIRNFVISANFHGGAEIVNYPWDTWFWPHADDEWFVQISRKYADQAHVDGPNNYMKAYDDGIVRGYEWYEVNGGRQDYMTFFEGGREVTIELTVQRNLAAQKLPIFWQANRNALLGYMANALEGICGVVTDTKGNPLDATIEVLNHDTVADSSWVYTDPAMGDYYRLIVPGMYDLKFSAIGYKDKVVEGVEVHPGPCTQLNVELK